MRKVVEIKDFQLVGNQVLQGTVLPGLQMRTVQIPLQPEIHKIDIHLYGNFIVGDGRVGNADFRRVAEICFGAVFTLAEVRNQPLCPFHKCLLLQLQPVFFSLPFACKFLRNTVSIHIVAVGLIVPYGIPGIEALVKTYHMEAVRGGDGAFRRHCRFFDPITSRCLRVCPFIRVIAIDAQILPRLLVVDSRTVILKAVTLHCTVHIALRSFFCFGQCLVVHLIIKPIFKMMVRNNQIRRCHPLGIIVDSLFGQPFRLFRERIVQFPHFGNLRMNTACPQMLFRTVACTKEILTVRTKAVQKPILLIMFQDCLFLLREEFVLADKLCNAALNFGPGQHNFIINAGNNDPQGVAEVCTVFLCQPCGSVPLSTMVSHVRYHSLFAFRISVPFLQGGINVSLRNFSYWRNDGRRYWWMLLRWLINMPCWLWRNLKNIYVILARLTICQNHCFVLLAQPVQIFFHNFVGQIAHGNSLRFSKEFPLNNLQPKKCCGKLRICLE